eukprot:TRINITY_DN7571_c0_g1_i1.p1 TRINITY_DN7571_c0_g1~~TRINITY_DN7571_c0_g1_i1.p1  ORF type:complete len:440 (+),score=80.96 TRINITY_DN7571_c0_g1_i1:185-1504(+)
MAKKKFVNPSPKPKEGDRQGWDRSYKVMLEDFLSNFIRALLLFILLTMLRLAVESLVGNTSPTNGQQGECHSEDERMSVRLSYKMAMAHRDAGLVGRALDYYDVVISQIKNSTLARDQLILSESLLNKGSLLLAYVGKVARLDLRASTLAYDNGQSVKETVGIARWVKGELKIFGRDGEIGIPRGGHESYAHLHPGRLVDEAIYTLSKAAKLGTTKKDKGTDLSVNLGLAVLVSQALAHDSASVEVVQDVKISFEKLASEDPTCTHLVEMIQAVLTSDEDLATALYKELSGDGFLSKVRGLGSFLKNIEKKEDPEWAAIASLDDPVTRLLDLDQCTVHADPATGVKAASKQRESFHHWLPQSSHLNQISILSTESKEDENADIIFVGKKKYFIEARSSHRMRGLYTSQEVPVEMSFSDDSPGVPQEAIELSRDWRGLHR